MTTKTKHTTLKAIPAIYEHGMFRPITPLNLPEAITVQISVRYVLPTISLDEAVALYATNQCNVTQAAELAGISLPEMHGVLYERQPFLQRYGHHTRAEIEALNERLEQAGPLAEQPTRPFDPAIDNNCCTIHEAIGLYLCDKCSLGRAAELAGVTYWEMQDIFKAHDIPIYGGSETTATEMDELIDQLKHEGFI